MRWLVLGATGSLGQAVVAECKRRNWDVVSAARSGTAHTVDVIDLSALTRLIQDVRPEGVVNCAAMVDLNACEADPAAAYAVNARPVSLLARWSKEAERPLIQVSTDQYFAENDADAAHGEDAPVTLLNEYGRTKFAAEAFALTSPHALVPRCNMAAAWPGKGKASIAAWAFDQLEARAPMTLFTDYYCSTLDAPTLAAAMFDLCQGGHRGVFNVASSEVFSKYEFVHALAAAAGITLDWAQAGSARDMDPPRSITAGLDVRKAEAALGRPLPDLQHVAQNFAAQRRAGP